MGRGGSGSENQDRIGVHYIISGVMLSESRITFDAPYTSEECYSCAVTLQTVDGDRFQLPEPGGGGLSVWFGGEGYYSFGSRYCSP